jgi:hypothetical protein
MSRENQGPWPRVRADGSERNSRVAHFQTPDVIQRSDRSLAGPLRLGTSRGVGPQGALLSGASDMEMDRVTPRGVDPIGSHNTREPAQPASQLVSRETRNSKKQD